MKARAKAILMSVAAMICFVMSVSAQKVSVAIVDQRDAAETSKYKLLMGAMVAIYIVYLILHNKRRKEVNRFMGKEEAI